MATATIWRNRRPEKRRCYLAGTAILEPDGSDNDLLLQKYGNLTVVGGTQKEEGGSEEPDDEGRFKADPFAILEGAFSRRHPVVETVATSHTLAAAVVVMTLSVIMSLAVFPIAFLLRLRYLRVAPFLPTRKTREIAFFTDSAKSANSSLLLPVRLENS